MEEQIPHQQYEQFPEIRWRKPTIDDLRHEYGEIQRTAEQFLGKDVLSGCGQKYLVNITQALLDGEFIPLDDALWSRLENTDSWDMQKGNMELLKQKCAENDRDYVKFLDMIRSSDDLPAATILEYDGRYHKVSGNTRLMVARVLGQRPYVLKGTYQDHDSK